MPARPARIALHLLLVLALASPFNAMARVAPESVGAPVALPGGSHCPMPDCCDDGCGMPAAAQSACAAGCTAPLGDLASGWTLAVATTPRWSAPSETRGTAVVVPDLLLRPPA